MDRAVARALRRRGIDVVTTAEAGLLGAPDTEQLAYACAHERVVVTYDDDFLRLNHQGHPHAGIAYFPRVRSIGEIIASLILMYEVIDSAEMAGSVEYL